MRRALPLLLVILGGYILFDYLKRHRRREEMRLFDSNNPPPSVVVSRQVGRGGFGDGDFATHVRPHQIGNARFK